MEFKNGVRVYSSDGKEAGSLHRVVIDPDTREVTHIVVQKGLISKEEKVISMNKIISASEDKVILTCTVDELKELSPLEVKRSMPLSDLTGEVQKYDRLAGGVYPSSASEPELTTEITRTIPEELIALKEGARVMSKDNRLLGTIEQVMTDPETGMVTHFVMAQGLLVRSKKPIPIEWVQLISDDEVQLTVENHLVEDFPSGSD